MISRNNMMVISFAISIVFWWLMLGTVELAVGFLALIFVHEMGHYLAAKLRGIKVSPPMFTPLGAFIAMESMPASAKEEAFVGIAGPVFGTIGGFLTLAGAYMLGVPEMATLASYAFMLNLFNLIPFSPLDGGRVSMAIDRRMWILGIPMVLYLVLTSGGSGFNLVILFLIFWQGMGDIRARKIMADQNPAYFDVGFGTRVGYAVAYLALGAFLWWALTSPQGLLHLFARIGLPHL